MAWTGKGWLYDGVSASRRQARLRLNEGWLGIEPENQSPFWWPLAEIRLTRLGGVWRAERAVNNAVPPYVLVEDERFAAEIRAWRPASPLSTGASVEAWKWLAALVLGAAFMVLLLWKVGLPWFADTLASRVPVEWEERLGRQVALVLAPRQKRCEDEPAAAVLAAMVEALRDGMTRGREYNYSVALANVPVANALAAPGGSIVIYRGLLERMEDIDQLAAVVAHEMQHVALRHSTRALFRSFALQMILGLVLGDASGMLAQTAGQLGDLKYMREDEEEADREGLLALARAGFSPGAMASMLRRLDSEETRTPEALVWLSSHPSPEARIRALERISVEPGPALAPPLSDSGWRALERACRER